MCDKQPPMPVGYWSSMFRMASSSPSTPQIRPRPRKFNRLDFSNKRPQDVIVECSDAGIEYPMACDTRAKSRPSALPLH